MQGERWTPAYGRMFEPDHELAGDPANRRWAFLDLCHNANWAAGNRIINGHLVSLKRGEVVASLRWMARRWDWSVKKVRLFVELLESSEVGKIETVKETPVGTVYRIVEYDTYANPGHSQGHGKGHTEGTPRAHRGHKEQQVTTSTEEEVTTHVETLWNVWLDELGGNGRTPKLTAKRKKKLEALYKEQLSDADDPEAAMRKICRAVKASDHHMSERAYQFPESLFRNEDRRDRWALQAAKGNGKVTRRDRGDYLPRRPTP